MPPKRKAAEQSSTTAKAAKKTKVTTKEAASKPSVPKASATPSAETVTTDPTVAPGVESSPSKDVAAASTRKASQANLQRSPRPCRATGAFECRQIENPFSEEPLEDPIYVLDGKQSDISLSKKEMPKGQENAAGTFKRGFHCDLEMDVGASGDCGADMISKVKGTFKMHRVWCDGDKELFEGYVDVTVTHGATLRRKGHGPSSGISTPIWAIRARRDEEGEEIGIDEGDGLFFGSGGGSNEFDFDEDEDEDSDEYGYY
ncbi:unnamed protein product [Peniophora sp. CBMAI 1063]|nr:unnamed protein product [Peniophora sp. CBMAI 1063]